MSDHGVDRRTDPPAPTWHDRGHEPPRPGPQPRLAEPRGAWTRRARSCRSSTSTPSRCGSTSAARVTAVGAAPADRRRGHRVPRARLGPGAPPRAGARRPAPAHREGPRPDGAAPGPAEPAAVHRRRVLPDARGHAVPRPAPARGLARLRRPGRRRLLARRTTPSTSPGSRPTSASTPGSRPRWTAATGCCCARRSRTSATPSDRSPGADAGRVADRQTRRMTPFAGAPDRPGIPARLRLAGRCSRWPSSPRPCGSPGWAGTTSTTSSTGCPRAPTAPGRSSAAPGRSRSPPSSPSSGSAAPGRCSSCSRRRHRVRDPVGRRRRRVRRQRVVGRRPAVPAHRRRRRAPRRAGAHRRGRLGRRRSRRRRGPAVPLTRPGPLDGVRCGGRQWRACRPSPG